MPRRCSLQRLPDTVQHIRSQDPQHLTTHDYQRAQARINPRSRAWDRQKRMLHNQRATWLNQTLWRSIPSRQSQKDPRVNAQDATHLWKDNVPISGWPPKILRYASVKLKLPPDGLLDCTVQQFLLVLAGISESVESIARNRHSIWWLDLGKLQRENYHLEVQQHARLAVDAYAKQDFLNTRWRVHRRQSISNIVQLAIYEANDVDNPDHSFRRLRKPIRNHGGKNS